MILIRFAKCFIIFIIVFSSCTNPEQVTIDLSGHCKFSVGDNLQWLKTDYNDASWVFLDPNKNWEEQGYSNYDGYAWYRYTFFLPAGMRIRAYLKDSLQINLGKIYNNDQVFLNGHIIGQNGINIPYKQSKLIREFENDSLVSDILRVYKLDVDDKRLDWNNENVLAIRVYNRTGLGGMLSKEKSLSMIDVKDYLEFNTNNKSFNFISRNHLSKSFSVENKSNEEVFSGFLKIEVKNIETDSIVYERETEVDFDENSSEEIAFDFILDISKIHQATYSFTEKNSKIVVSSVEDVPYILTPVEDKLPNINCAKVVGTRIGNPFMFKVATSGEKPIRYYAEKLPNDLVLDSISGIIKGKLWANGIYEINLIANNHLGTDNSVLKIIVGNDVSKTPPMGWSAERVIDSRIVNSEFIHNSAKSINKSDLINYGYSYVQIGNGWQGMRNITTNEIYTNHRFPKLKALSDSVHKMGLKIGLSSSPGKITCDSFPGSYSYVHWDVWQYFKHRIDYLKYDWCSYENIVIDNSLRQLQRPFKLMKGALSYPKRNVIYHISLNKTNAYEVGNIVEPNVCNINEFKYNSWDDIVNNFIGNNKPLDINFWPELGLLNIDKSSVFSINEKYSQLSLWCLMSAPLFISFDLAELNEFTKGLLCNSEVIAINQDENGGTAESFFKDNGIEMWSKMLQDSSLAIGIFNLNDNLVNYNINFKELNLKGKSKVRDLWRQKDISLLDGSFVAGIPKHGVLLIRVW